jgi:hypothetical protein
MYFSVTARVEDMLARLAERRAWLTLGVAAAIALSLLITFPRISFFLGNDGQISNFWPFVERQAQSQLSMNQSFYNGDESTHESKRAFRLALPILMRVLHGDWLILLVLQAALGVAMLYLVGKIAWELFGDRVVALASVFGVSAIYAGKAAFLQLGGVGDAFAYAFLTIAAAYRSGPLIAASIFAACFTDERAIVAAPLVGLYWVFRQEHAPAWLNRQTVAVALAVSAALAVRLYLMRAYGLYVSIGSGKNVGLDVLARTLPELQYALPHVLTGLWLWPLVAAKLLLRHRQWLALSALTVGAVALTAVAFLVLDVDRSLSYLLPLLYVAMAIAAKYRLSLADAKSIAIAAMLLAFLFPVNNLFGAGNRYSSGNLLPVELVRFYVYLHR